MRGVLMFLAGALVAAGGPFEIVQKNGATQPVAYLKPTTPNQVMAFDVAPTGRPKQLGNHGTAWIDVLEHGEAGPLSTARVGINDGAAWFGSMAFGGAKARPVEIVVGSKPVIRARPDGVDFVSRGRVIGAIDFAGEKLVLRGFDQVDALERRVRAIERK